MRRVAQLGRSSTALAQDIADELGWRHDVIFTSGASEAVEIVARRASGIGPRLMEQPSMQLSRTPWVRTRRIIQVGTDGLIDEAALDQVLAGGPALVAIQQVNNETGIIQPLDRIVPRIRDAGSLLARRLRSRRREDAAARCRLHRGLRSQAWWSARGWCPCWSRIWRRSSRVGGQEKGYRRGTQDVPSAAGFAAALLAQPYDLERLTALRCEAGGADWTAGGVIIGGTALEYRRSAHTPCRVSPARASSSSSILRALPCPPAVPARREA